MRAASLYRSVDHASRVESASPHGLVAILFDECLTGIATLEAAYGRGLRAHETNARVQGILHALEASLDHANGGETAALMARVYREVRRCLSQAAADIDPLWCKRARETIAPIAEAWCHIAQAA